MYFYMYLCMPMYFYVYSCMCMCTCKVPWASLLAPPSLGAWGLATDIKTPSIPSSSASVCIIIRKYHPPLISRERNINPKLTFLSTYLSIHTPIHQYTDTTPFPQQSSSVAENINPTYLYRLPFPTNLPPTNLLLLSPKCFRASWAPIGTSKIK